MQSRLREFAITAILCLPLSTIVASGEGDGPWSLDFSTGAEYDSNVAVLELDTSSGQADVAALIDLGLGLDVNLSENLGLKLGYDFSEKLHHEFDGFDRRIHRGSGELSYDFGRTDVGATYHHADAALDGDEFLVLKRISPYLSRLFGERLFVRLAYARTDKEFEASPGRDAVAEAWQGDAFVFLDGVDRYLVFGYVTLDEDARDDQFDHAGARLKARFVHRFSRGTHGVQFETSARYESRNYDEALLPLAGRREDDRYGIEAELEVALSRHWFLRPRFAYNDNRSTLSSVDFDEHVVSLEIGAEY